MSTFREAKRRLAPLPRAERMDVFFAAVSPSATAGGAGGGPPLGAQAAAEHPTGVTRDRTRRVRFAERDVNDRLDPWSRRP